MFNVYLYVMDTMADWEVGHITTELNSKRFFKKDAPEVSFKTVGISKEAVKSMGGLTIVPDCVIDDMRILFFYFQVVMCGVNLNTWKL